MAKQHVNFTVHGEYYHKDAIESIGKLNPDYELSLNEIKTKYTPDDTKICKYTFEIHNVQLVPEPSNPHDPNAVKVLMNGAHIGYISAKSTDRVKEYMNSGKIESITGKIEEGPYVYTYTQNNGNYSTRREDANYKASLTLHLSEKLSSSVPTAGKAAASAGSGCLLPIMMGISLIGIVIALL